MDEWTCLKPTNAGSLLAVSVVPGAKRTEVMGLHDGTLRIRLAAPPVDGKANEALVAWLAQELAVQRRSIELVRGQTSRRKQLRIDCPPAVLEAWLASRLD
jgi:uncharacterized protein (TIGR00251 family)